MRIKFIAAASALAIMLGGAGAVLAGTTASEATQASAANAISAAVAAPGRPETAHKLDAGRKPVAVLMFLGFRPGMDSADLISGGGYWAEIMAQANGTSGSVTAFEPEQFFNQKAWDGLLARDPAIGLVKYKFEHFPAGEPRFDFALTNLNYHDLYWESEKFHIARSNPEDFVKALYSSMRPGGIVGVIDHVGKQGDTRAIVAATHRIAPEVVIADFTRAGFVLDGRSDLLANPADDHTKLVFDPAIRGKTDRFILRFRKPG